MMKYLATFAALLLAAGIHHANAADLEGTPDTIDYQGRVFDLASKPLGIDAGGHPNPTNYTVQFRIYNALTGGNLLWSESQLVTISDGHFSVRLGQGTAVASDGIANPVPLKQIFEGKSRYLGVTVLPLGASSGGEIAPRLAFLSNPFAITAERAKQADFAAKAAVADSVTQASGASTFDVTTIKTATIANATISENVNVTGNVTANQYTGKGAALTDLNASNLSSGILGDARLSDNIARRNGSNSFSGVNTFSSTQNSFTGNGAGLTNLNASTITTGVLPDARLSASIIKNFSLNDKLLYLRTSGDENHVLRWGGGTPWNIDGAVLTGNAGGILGITHNTNTTDYLRKPILKWADDGITAHRGIFLQNEVATDSTKASTYQGKWRLYQRNADHTTSHTNGTEFRLGWIAAGESTPTDINGQIGTYFWWQSGGRNGHQSDRRLKKDIAPMGSVLESVLKLQPVHYRLKGVEDAPLIPGYIAQDVEPHFPRAVSLHDGYYGLSYDNLAVYTTRALQELAVESREAAEAAKDEIERLKTENEALRRRLDALEARLP